MSEIKGVVFDFGGVMTTCTMPERVRPLVRELGISWEALEAGFTPDAVLTDAEEALNALNERMLELDGQEGSISVIAMDPEGNFGAATTLPVFPFVVGGEDGTRLMAVFNTASGPVVRAATEEELTQCD